ncbi:MAG: type II toxin-antitoxin system HicA family toxin [Candidatus Bathyarchaeota archaeon]|nr:type II toxin-antitoxin system HicA family toxin [Candidatus Bathyarchaeota archaeon]
MSEKLPTLSYRKLLKILNEANFKIVHQKGSHIFLTDGKRKVTVQRHDVIQKGTLLAIIQQAGLTKEEFLRFLK